MNLCKSCKIEKSLISFPKDKDCKNGIRPICKNCVYLKKKNWIISNKEHLTQYQKTWKQNNKEHYLAYQKSQYLQNLDNRKQYAKTYCTKKRKSDIQFVIKNRLRARLRQALKRKTKVGSAIKDLGCSILELKQYLESKFQEGMSWDNCNKWHIDHIKPLSKFDLTDKLQLLQACHYTNLQPLWAIDNIRKGNNV